MTRLERLEHALSAMKDQAKAATSGKMPPVVDRSALKNAQIRMSEYRQECSEIINLAKQTNTPIPDMTPEHLKQIA